MAQPITCPCCRDCEFDDRRRMCDCGGPYEGYLDLATGDLIDHEGTVLRKGRRETTLAK